MPGWDAEFDVVVVGSGAAGCAAALAASQAGATVVMLDKAAEPGGTTRLSAGGYWVPNNSLMRQRGLDDPRPEALELMARLGYPAKYDGNDKQLGLEPAELSLLETFYDEAGPTVDKLTAVGALNPMMFPTLGYSDDEVTDPDYHAGLPEHRAPYGHLLTPTLPPDFDFVSQMPGRVLSAELLAAAEAAGTAVLTEHRVAEAVTLDGAVAGVVCENGLGGKRIRARGGVVFASGGFAHDPAKAQAFLRGPIFGSGSAPESTGDFVDIAAGLGAGLGNMTNAWWCQVALEGVLGHGGGPGGRADMSSIGGRADMSSIGGRADMSSIVFIPYGDSMIIVNGNGLRVGDEKAMYNERTQSHFSSDGRDWPNLIQYMIWDASVAAEATPWPWRSGVPLPGAEPPWLLVGDTITELAAVIARRLDQLRGRRGISGRIGSNLVLNPAFLPNLERTIDRFNHFAATGSDQDFGRGQTPVARAWCGPLRRGPNPTMFPLAGTGPYYAVMLAAGTLDTCGGPVIDAGGAVLRSDGSTIAGLFGAGNCVASPTGQGYLGGGGTIGPALAFGWVAGTSAARRLGGPG